MHKKIPPYDRQEMNQSQYMPPPQYQYPPIYPYPYPPHYPYQSQYQQMQNQQEEEHLSLVDKISIIEDLKYGNNWRQIKDKILPYEYDYQGFEIQKSPIRPQNKFKEDNYQDEGIGRAVTGEKIPKYPPYHHHYYPNQPMPYKQTKQNLSHEEPNRQKQKIQKSSKSISYRSQIKYQKKTITEERLEQKYREFMKQYFDQYGQEEACDQIKRKHKITKHYRNWFEKFKSDTCDSYSEQQHPRYFQAVNEYCKKCVSYQHENQYCIQNSPCIICLSRHHEPKNCHLKYLCTKCWKIGHRIDKCTFTNEKEHCYCSSCQRHHIPGQYMNFSSGYCCFSLTKGDESQNKEINTQQIKNWKQIKCIKCSKTGHYLCS